MTGDKEFLQIREVREGRTGGGHLCPQVPGSTRLSQSLEEALGMGYTQIQRRGKLGASLSRSGSVWVCRAAQGPGVTGRERCT